MIITMLLTILVTIMWAACCAASFYAGTRFSHDKNEHKSLEKAKVRVSSEAENEKQDKLAEQFRHELENLFSYNGTVQE